MLSGTGWLYAGDERYRVGPGDFFAKAEGPKLAHQFVNDGEGDLRILSIGEHRDDDAVEHPTAPWLPGALTPGSDEVHAPFDLAAKMVAAAGARTAGACAADAGSRNAATLPYRARHRGRSAPWIWQTCREGQGSRHQAWRHRQPRDRCRGAEGHRGGNGSVTDKATAATEAIRDPGAPGDGR